jgi:hypothetical protein
MSDVQVPCPGILLWLHKDGSPYGVKGVAPYMCPRCGARGFGKPRHECGLPVYDSNPAMEWREFSKVPT